MNYRKAFRICDLSSNIGIMGVLTFPIPGMILLGLGYIGWAIAIGICLTSSLFLISAAEVVDSVLTIKEADEYYEGDEVLPDDEDYEEEEIF